MIAHVMPENVETKDMEVFLFQKTLQMRDPEVYKKLLADLPNFIVACVTHFRAFDIFCQ